MSSIHTKKSSSHLNRLFQIYRQLITHHNHTISLFTLFTDLAKEFLGGRAGLFKGSGVRVYAEKSLSFFFFSLWPAVEDGIWTKRWDWDDGNGTMGENAGDGVPDLSNPRRCVWVSSWIWRGHRGFQPDPAETHARPLSLARYRERFGRNTTYSGRFSLPLFLCHQPVCMGAGSLFLSLSLSPVRSLKPFFFF